MWRLNYLFLGYTLIINVIAIVITIIDKKAAKKHKKRISENNLMLVTLLGGGVGMYITMLSIRHKTKHSKFMVGIPLIIVIESILLGLLIYYFH